MVRGAKRPVTQICGMDGCTKLAWHSGHCLVPPSSGRTRRRGDGAAAEDAAALPSAAPTPTQAAEPSVVAAAQPAQLAVAKPPQPEKPQHGKRKADGAAAQPQAGKAARQARPQKGAAARREPEASQREAARAGAASASAGTSEPSLEAGEVLLTLGGGAPREDGGGTSREGDATSASDAQAVPLTEDETSSGDPARAASCAPAAGAARSQTADTSGARRARVRGSSGVAAPAADDDALRAPALPARLVLAACRRSEGEAAARPGSHAVGSNPAVNALYSRLDDHRVRNLRAEGHGSKPS